jgi:predicted ArsR family transcriptional regulator
LLEQSASASQALDEMPAEDMHCAVLNISRACAEICEMAERIVASSARELDHGKRADGKKADGMSAGG